MSQISGFIPHLYAQFALLVVAAYMLFYFDFTCKRSSASLHAADLGV
jgi:hypothetical protein